MASVDLHLHTTRSDGRWQPARVVAEAARRGLSVIAITDHDVLSGLEEASQAATECGVELIAGIELTADWNGRACHILGYGVDPRDPALVGALEAAAKAMADHVQVLLKAVREDGFEIEQADLARYNTRYATGTSVVLAMLERGVLRGSPRARELLALAAREPRGYTASEAIDLIHGAGGVAVLAHPARLRRKEPLLPPAFFEPLAAAGLDGLELWHIEHRQPERDHYAQVARDLDLLVSGGSDCHGPRSSGVRMGGQAVPDWVAEVIRERIASRRSGLVRDVAVAER